MRGKTIKPSLWSLFKPIVRFVQPANMIKKCSTNKTMRLKPVHLLLEESINNVRRENNANCSSIDNWKFPQSLVADVSIAKSLDLRGQWNLRGTLNFIIPGATNYIPVRGWRNPGPYALILQGRKFSKHGPWRWQHAKHQAWKQH